MIFGCKGCGKVFCLQEYAILPKEEDAWLKPGDQKIEAAKVKDVGICPMCLARMFPEGCATRGAVTIPLAEMS